MVYRQHSGQEHRAQAGRDQQRLVVQAELVKNRAHARGREPCPTELTEQSARGRQRERQQDDDEARPERSRGPEEWAKWKQDHDREHEE